MRLISQLIWLAVFCWGFVRYPAFGSGDNDGGEDGRTRPESKIPQGSYEGWNPLCARELV